MHVTGTSPEKMPGEEDAGMTGPAETSACLLDFYSTASYLATVSPTDFPFIRRR